MNNEHIIFTTKNDNIKLSVLLLIIQYKSQYSYHKIQYECIDNGYVIFTYSKNNDNKLVLENLSKTLWNKVEELSEKQI